VTGAMLSVDYLPSQLEQVFRYVRDWNTNGKLSHVAQAILYTLLRRFTSEDLLALKESKPVRAVWDAVCVHRAYADRWQCTSFAVQLFLYRRCKRLSRTRSATCTGWTSF